VTDSAEDTRLIGECLRGDTESFAVLVRKYQDRLHNVVFRVVGNAEDARDLVQDVFVQAYRSLDRFHGDSAFFTWLYRIAVNAAISHKRRERVMVSYEAARDATGFEPAEDTSQTDPSGPLEQDDRVRQVRAALDSLPADYRAVLVLKEIDGQKYEAIAQILNCPIGTVRSRLHRARMELRDRLRHMMLEE
jgi:RNA polymerase sigma-70 factor (ECF subfamily)